MMYKIYLDDVRIPIQNDWIHVKDYEEFILAVEKYGLSNIMYISLDHDLGKSAMDEWERNVAVNGTLDYDNITEKTGYDCAKWLVNLSMDTKTPLPMINVHSSNTVGVINITSLINNYNVFSDSSIMCTTYRFPHTIDENKVREYFK